MSLAAPAGVAAAARVQQAGMQVYLGLILQEVVAASTLLAGMAVCDLSCEIEDEKSCS